MFKHIVSYFARQSRSRALAHELGAMSDRQLSDIGLSRGDIDFVVRQSYGPEAQAPQQSGEAYGRNSTLVSIYAGSRLA